MYGRVLKYPKTLPEKMANESRHKVDI